MNDDLDQMRVLYARLTAHQMLALEVIASGDDMLAEATRLIKSYDNGWTCIACHAGHESLRATIDDYAAKRANFERVLTEHENG